MGGSVKNAMSNLFDALRFHGSRGRAVFVGSQDISKRKPSPKGGPESKMVSYWDYNEFRLASTYLFTAMEKFSIMEGFFSEDISFKADEAPYIGQNDRSTKANR